MKLKGEGSSGELNGFLDAGSHLQGDLHFEDTFRVDGKISGTVSSKGDLVVGESGLIEGEIRVGRVYVSGTVKGEIEASRRVEISALGKVYGEIRTTSLVIEDGAHFEGQCSMTLKAEGAKAEQAPATPIKPIALTKGSG